MPVVQVNIKQGRTLDQKREIVARMTEVLVEVCGAARERVHVIINEEKAGPFTLEQIQNMRAAGTITLETYVWASGMKDWQRLGGIAAIVHPDASSPAQAKTSAQQPTSSAIAGTQASSRQRSFSLLSLRVKLIAAGIPTDA